MRDLMLMVAVSPALYWLVRRYALLWLGIIGLLFVCGVGATFPGFSNYALLFFSLGACFRIKEIDLLGFVQRRLVWLGAGAVFLLLSVVWYARPYAQQFQYLFFVVGIFGLMSVGYAFAACFIAGVCVLLYKVLEKYAPWTLKVLSGGR